VHASVLSVLSRRPAPSGGGRRAARRTIAPHVILDDRRLIVSPAILRGVHVLGDDLSGLFVRFDVRRDGGDRGAARPEGDPAAVTTESFETLDADTRACHLQTGERAQLDEVRVCRQTEWFF
jgi:hypothetical protein